MSEMKVHRYEIHVKHIDCGDSEWSMNQDSGGRYVLYTEHMEHIAELERQLGEAQEHNSQAIDSMIDIAKKLYTAEGELSDAESREDDYRQENIKLQAEIARMRPVVESFGKFNEVCKTKYKDRFTTIAERGEAMTALQIAYLVYEQSTTTSKKD